MDVEKTGAGACARKVLSRFGAGAWPILAPVLLAAFLLTRAFGRDDYKFVHDEDGRQYYQTAVKIKEQGLFLSPTNGDLAPYAFRLPYYQTFLSFFVRQPAVSGTFQPLHAALELTFCSLIFLGFMIAGSLMAGILALCCSLVFLYFNLNYGLDIEVQAFYAMMIALFLLCGINFLNRGTRFSALLWGLSSGLSRQVRSSLFVYVALCAVILSLKQKYRAHALIFLAAVIFMHLPLAFRNYRLFHEFIPFEKDAAVQNIYIASLGVADSKDFNTTESLGKPLDDEYTWGDNAAKYRILRDAIRKNLVSHPWRYLAGFLKRLRYSLEICPMLLPVLLFSLYKKEPIPMFIGSLCCYYVLIHCLMYIQLRYFFPIQLPVYILSFYMIGAVFFNKDPLRDAEAIKRTEWTAIAFIFPALLVYARQAAILLRQAL